MELRVLALYPEQMNIYADRGNIVFLRKRCEWRGIEFAYTAAGEGEWIDPGAHDLIYIGGGQDRDQRAVAADMVETKREALGAAVDDGAVLLAVCGGYQLLGHSYQLGEEKLPGLGLADLETIREPGPRLIGNVAIEADLGAGPRLIAGFENHGGRTYLGAGAEALGLVVKGFGNNGSGRSRGRAPRQPLRHLPARAATPQERLAGRPPDRPRPGAPLRRATGAGAAGRRPRVRRPRVRPVSFRCAFAPHKEVKEQRNAFQRPLEPKPPSPRADSASASTSTGSASAIGVRISWAIRSPGSIRKVSAGSVLSSRTRTSPR